MIAIPRRFNRNADLQLAHFSAEREGYLKDFGTRSVPSTLADKCSQPRRTKYDEAVRFTFQVVRQADQGFRMRRASDWPGP
jgi:hypothetical protein